MRADWIAGTVVLAGLLVATQAPRAELYRCPAPDGRTVFTDNPNACPGAREHQPSAAIQKLPAAAAPARARVRDAPSRASMQAQAEADQARAWRQKKTQKQQELEQLGARRERLLEFVTWCNRGGELYRRDRSGLKSKMSCREVYGEMDALEAQMTSVQAYLDEGLEEECRRAGCLPGWIR